MLYWLSWLQFWLLQLHLYMTLLYSYSFGILVDEMPFELLFTQAKT